MPESIGHWGSWGEPARQVLPLTLRASSAEMALWGEGFDDQDVTDAAHVMAANRVVPDPERRTAEELKAAYAAGAGQLATNGVQRSFGNQ